MLFDGQLRDMPKQADLMVYTHSQYTVAMRESYRNAHGRVSDQGVLYNLTIMKKLLKCQLRDSQLLSRRSTP